MTWRAFPVEALPDPVHQLVTIGSRAMQCDPSFIALSALSAIASVIGATRSVAIFEGWTEPAILWSVIVGESGTLKTPAIRLATKPLCQLQAKLMDEYAQLVSAYEQDKAEYERAYSKWRSKGEGELPTKPSPPPQPRVVISNITVEAVGPILGDNPRGLLLVRDELAGWIGSFDRYSSGRGADVNEWLPMHSGETLLVDRKTSGTIYVSRAHVSIAGGIQPETLRRALGREHITNGLAARLLMAYPPRPQRRWTGEHIPPAIEAKYACMIERLRELQPEHIEGEPQPVLLRFDSDAKELWADYFNRHHAEQSQLTGAIASAWSKLEGGAARLALIVHLVRWAAREPVSESHIDSISMNAGITLADWFKGEAARIYDMLCESEAEAEDRELVDWIRARGGAVTVRDLVRGPRRFRGKADLAQKTLDDLVARGLGDWEHPKPGPKGGHPTLVFRLADLCDGDSTSTGEAKSDGSVADTSEEADSDDVGIIE